MWTKVWCGKNIVASTMRHAKIDKFILTSSNLIPLQMPSVLQQTQVEVEQLRREAAMKRIPVSQAVEDIKVRFPLWSREYASLSTN